MKVVLANPPQVTRYFQPPMGLSLIAAVLEKEGHQVSMLDANALRLQPQNVVPLVADAEVVGCIDGMRERPGRKIPAPVSLPFSLEQRASPTQHPITPCRWTGEAKQSPATLFFSAFPSPAVS